MLLLSTSHLPLLHDHQSLMISSFTFFFSDLLSQSTSNKAEKGCISWINVEGGEVKHFTCSDHYSAKFETEARSLPSSTCNSDSTSTLPAWLQKYKNEKREQNSADQVTISS